MLNILICDDRKEQATLVQYFIKKYEEIEDERIFNTYCTESSKEVIKYIKRQPIDIAILDIEIDETNGIDLAEQIKQIDKNILIIFITSYTSYGYDAYKVEAFDYILKPINSETINKTIKKIIDSKMKNDFIKKYMQPRLKIKFRGEISNILQQEILYIEKVGKKVVLVTENTSYEYTVNLKDLEENLEKEMFIRCHHGFIININHIVAYKKFKVYVGSKNLCIPVSKSNSENLRNILEQRLWENIP
ncbi:LytR/AlgR family response regulator transcription factor [Clostridium cellulovorans]|uniref:Stage 0 sporulation protein A homolog n=1 Tax=Clostridium cellulovorans (strain ATCC 35296 / DSM 3052 / OCM 3 / 743B) TaxID=573061 RepID=D9SP62_CLOC7|nr:LytTR family DNA-binding domain-containing protein [Clostridium cellulovorans]ADL52027.1 two component transcriptional regulator, LytTR family [Clostridium cellulovorans 743B]